MKELRKIREGMSGNEAAQVIYNNDSDLFDKITACKSVIEANKAYVAQINSSSGKTNVGVEQYTGPSVTDVMSQSGVTREINRIDSHLEHMCGLADLDIPETLDPPITDVVNATYAVQASRDAEGHILTAMYYDIKDLQKSILEIAALKAEIDKLKRRVEVLESKVK